MIMPDINDVTSAAGAGRRGPDAHGFAALLLVESLIHGLIDRSIITVQNAAEIADVAVEVNTEVVIAGAGEPTATATSLQLLQRISSSLKIDLQHGAP